MATKIQKNQIATTLLDGWTPSLKQKLYWDSLKTRMLGHEVSEETREKIRQSKFKPHAKSHSSVYKIWMGIKTRCYDKKCHNYKDYGGRGILLSDDWLDFNNFRSDMEKGYKRGLSIDRIDNNKGYSKENCRWADSYTQMNNTRYNIFIEYMGQKKTLAEWARELGFRKTTLCERYRSPKYKGDKLFQPLDCKYSKYYGYKS